MKKAIALLLALSLSVCVFAACGNDTSSSSQAGGSSQSQSASGSSSEAPKGDPDKIVVTFLTGGNNPADLDKVLALINERTIEAINVEVEWKTLSIPDSFSNYSLWITSGERMDLMCVAFSGLAAYVNSGQIEPLDDLLANYASTISTLSQEFPITEGAIYGGETFGVSPVMPSYGNQCAYLIRQEYLDEINLERKDMYTLADLTEIFAQIKELHPDLYPCGITGNSINAGDSIYGYMGQGYDTLGATTLSGVLMSMDSTEVVNLYETDEYYNYLVTVRDWYEKGYIMTDAATNDMLSTDLIGNSITAGYAMMNRPEQIPMAETSYGFPFEALCLSEPFRPAVSSSGGTFWTVPITSQAPEAAIKFLDLLYADHDLANLVFTGIEGEHYELLDAEQGVIGNNDPSIYGSLGLWGDRRYEYTTSSAVTRQQYEDFTERASENSSIAGGYVYDTSAMGNQLIAIQSVMDEYQASLETGSVRDLDSTYQTFLSKLRDAGIDDVIADNQAQFDAWLAMQ